MARREPRRGAAIGFLDVRASVPSFQLLERKRRREYLEELTLANQLCLG
jgi:hypothetical protein